MKQLTIVAIKFITYYIAFTIGLDLFFDASIVEVLSFSIIVTTMTYMIGDRILLGIIGVNNTVIIEFFIAYTSVWIFGSVILNGYNQIGWGSIISASLIAIVERALHPYLLKTKVDNLRKKFSRVRPKLAYQMEMAEEEEPRKKR